MPPEQAEHTLPLDEGQRQLVLMALAHLYLKNPGWDFALSQIALKIDNKRPDGKAEMYETFASLEAKPLRFAGLPTTLDFEQIAILTGYADHHCDSMEGANNPEFTEHEQRMCAAMDILEKFGYKYDPIRQSLERTNLT